MKKAVLTVAAGILALGISAFAAGSVSAASQPVEVLLNANKLNFPDAKPFQDGQGSVMVPIRFVSDALGGTISYSKSGGKSVVEVRKGNHTVKMTVGQTSAEVNGQIKDYGTKVILKQNRTFVPLRLVSEGLGEKVQWDKIGRWVWIGEKNFRNTDDPEFKLQPLSDFKAYMKSTNQFRKFSANKEPFDGIKIIQANQLPIKLGNGEIIYDIRLEKSNGNDYIAIRSSERGTPVFFMVKNDFVKYRQGLDNAFVNHKDGTATNYYPVMSTSDVYQNGQYNQYYDWTKFRLTTADYIAFSTHQPKDYLVAIVNPFK
ncbi:MULTISPECIES: copper amine oxidase N-terminal domain-containing protein [Paenibacillus]|uniref:Copper amine oxidase n=1 Tax=Paenibacillus campinasensis TaxID=66347 RepID=A0A268EDG9_9BACL|nr:MULTISPECIES: copper amine oxidase N-terminal domain-containing protein [Paenibacillus]MUG67889.1 copper amine oxidase N-terminal domain-containing protein [Paenibacillus campinasensis]PAD71165.1 copper amine oxidase [Paenibacillus campinasensis]PAK49719.1 copper amine oxidase [Paenibacillus sp. 7541]